MRFCVDGVLVVVGCEGVGVLFVDCGCFEYEVLGGVWFVGWGGGFDMMNVGMKDNR